MQNDRNESVALELRDLSKTYGRGAKAKRAVSDVSLRDAAHGYDLPACASAMCVGCVSNTVRKRMLKGGKPSFLR
ncbi:hypothetical protein ACIGGE_12230 [Qipengyuania sp. NPDC077410]|uniref:hypothetical protein n=1 Tax=Qipengyuania sp. NPDC077410 TaxID=3364496 RepID=UPI0037CA4F33